jgi:DNA-binding MarR family transcriptional regulator
MSSPPHPSAVPGAILARISRLHLSWKRYVQRRLAPYGVTPKQLYVLRQLDERGHLLPSDVARLTHADRPTVSSMCRTMERAGWIATRPAADDGRKRHLVLRPAGRALLGRIPADRWRSGQTPIDPEACLDAGERRRLHELLGRMCQTLEGDPSWEAAS